MRTNCFLLMLVTLGWPLATCQGGPITTQDVTNAANLYITCDNSYMVWWNGQLIGKGDNWRRLDKYEIKVKQGDILAILAMDQDPHGKSAGFFCCITLPEVGKSWGVSHKWRCAEKEPKGEWKTDPSMSGFYTMSEKNVHPFHLSRVPQYKETQDPLIRGQYVWSEKPVSAIWIKQIIDMEEFKSPSNTASHGTALPRRP